MVSREGTVLCCVRQCTCVLYITCAVSSPSAGCDKVVECRLDKALVLLQHTSHVTPTVLQNTRHVQQQGLGWAYSPGRTHIHCNCCTAAAPTYVQLSPRLSRMHTTQDTCCSSPRWQQWPGRRCAQARHAAAVALRGILSLGSWTRPVDRQHRQHSSAGRVAHEG